MDKSRTKGDVAELITHMALNFLVPQISPSSLQYSILYNGLFDKILKEV